MISGPLSYRVFRETGPRFSTDPEITKEPNYSDRLAKVNQRLDSWKCRRLSLLVYILSPLPTNYRVLKELRKSLFNFLWSSKGDKIKRNVMIGDYSDGGLKMIDLKSFNKALKSTWVKKNLDLENHGKWKHFNFWFWIAAFWWACHLQKQPRKKRRTKRRHLGSLHDGNLANLVRRKL